MAVSWVFTDNTTYLTVERTIHGFTFTYVVNKQLIKLFPYVEPEMIFHYSKPEKLLPHEWLVDYNLVTSPVSTSAANLAVQLQAMIDCITCVGAGAAMIVFAIEAGDFTYDTYQDARLIGKTPVTDFSVFTNEGSGVLQKLDDGYTFDDVTGTLTMPAGNYQIEIYG